MSEQVWVVRAGRNGIFVKEFLERQLVAIGWGRVGNLTQIHGREPISLLVEERFPEYTKVQGIVNSGQIYRFRDELTRGSNVVTYDPGNREYHLGKVDGDYKYQPDLNEHMQHTRAVKWIGTIARDILTPATRNSLGSIATIFCVSEAAAGELLSLLIEGPVINLTVPVEEELEEAAVEVRKDTEQRALEFLQDKLSTLSWEEMQELVAGLLRAMGYKTRVSPAGPDRGRDIIASPDVFGFQDPRILVEVKHRKGQMGAPQVRSFAGGLRPNDNGLYVSTGGFSREARYEADRANMNLTLMDSDDLGNAIVEHYDQMDLETRTLLPLKKIYWPV